MRSQRFFLTPWKTTRWLIAVGALVGALAGLVVGLRLDNTMVSSQSQILFSAGSTMKGTADAVATEDQYLSNRLSTYGQLALSDRVLGPAAAQLGTTAAGLRPRVSVSPEKGTNILTVAVQDATPRQAAAGARAIDLVLVSAITALETSPGQAPPVAAMVTSAPTVPAHAIAPPPAAVAAAGTAFGILVVVLAAALWASSIPHRAGRALVAWVLNNPISPSRGPQAGTVRQSWTAVPPAPVPAPVPPQDTAPAAATTARLHGPPQRRSGDRRQAQRLP